MRYYPVYLDIQHKKCLVVGGGSVGTRKVNTLVECGALVTVVSPEISEALSRNRYPRGARVERELTRAVKTEDYERAAELLNLDRVPPAQQAADGPKLARWLKVVLDRRLWV